MARTESKAELVRRSLARRRMLGLVDPDSLIDDIDSASGGADPETLA